jgi:toxin FitB
VYLLDTNVISRTSPVASTDWHRVRDWIENFGESSYVSVISLGELQYGAARLTEKGAHRKADELYGWVESIAALFHDRLLPVDLQIARRTGEFLARAEFAGHKPGFEDACIAATAALHRLIVVTHNIRHFEVFGVRFQEPAASGTEGGA